MIILADIRVLFITLPETLQHNNLISKQINNIEN